MASNKKILIYNKFYKLDQPIGIDYCHNNDDFQSSDRFNTIVDQVLTCHVKMKNHFVAFFYNYWFYNNDFRKQKSLSSKSASKIRVLINSIFWLSIIGLILCLIFGLALPIIKSTFDSYKLFNGTYEGSLVSNNNIIGWIVTQGSLYPVIDNVQTSLVNAKNDLQTFFDNPSNIWLKQYLIQYFMPANNLAYDPNDFSTLQFGTQMLLDHLNMNMVSEFKYIYFTDDLQVLTYFSLVNGSLSSTLTSAQLTEIFSSYRDLHFNSELLANNIFYGLKANRIFLNGNQTTQTLLIPDVWAAWFSNAEVIVPMCFTLLFLAIIIFHYQTIKKNNPKFTNMNMYDYVSAKIKYTKKIPFLLKKLVFLNPNIDNLKHNFVFNFNKLDNSSTYNTLRLLNYAYSSVESMSIILVADYDQKLLETYENIIKNDTKNLAIKVVDEKTLLPLINSNQSSKSTNKKGFSIVKTIPANQVVYDQYRNYLYSYLQYWQENNEFDIFKQHLLNIAKVNKKQKLTSPQKQELIKEVSSKIEFNIRKNQMFNKTKIKFKSFNNEINNLVNKLLKEAYEAQK